MFWKQSEKARILAEPRLWHCEEMGGFKKIFVVVVLFFF
jgi:hypothetical protein